VSPPVTMTVTVTVQAWRQVWAP